MTRALLKRLLGRISRGLFRLEVHDAHAIPARGPCILVFNHLSNLDPHLLFTLMPRADAVGLVAAEYRTRPLVRWLVEACGGLWLHRGKADRATLRRALVLLEGGALVGLAPEGRRSPDGRLGAGRPGAAFLALRSGAPVLPVALEGTERALATLRRGRRPRVVVRFGEPFFLKDPLAPSQPGERREELEEGTRRIMEALAALLPRERRSPSSTTIQGPSPNLRPRSTSPSTSSTPLPGDSP